MEFFWYFVLYSFLGFLLEVGFARLIRAEKQDRKCFFLLPLCPVYGFGALAILLLPRAVLRSGPLLVLVGGLVATGVEYLMAVVYEKGLGVGFWDYSGQRGNLQGRVCPLFTVFWGLLAAVLVRRLHPTVTAMVAHIPPTVTGTWMLLLAADGLYTAVLLRRTRTTDSLRWYLRS